MHSKSSSFIKFSALAILAFMCFPLAIAAAAHPTGALSLASLAFAPICMEPADDNPTGSGGGSVDLKQALAQVEDTKLPIGQRISVAISALRGVDPTQQLAAISAQLSAAQAKVAEHESTIAAHVAKIATLEASNVQFSDRATALERENTEIKAKEQDLEKRAEAKAKEKVAALGFQANQLPAATETEGRKQLARAEFDKLSHTARNKFIRDGGQVI